MQKIRVFVETDDTMPSFHKDVGTLTSGIYKALKDAGYKNVGVHYHGSLPLSYCTYCEKAEIDNGTLFSESPRNGKNRHYCGCRGWD